MKKVHKRLWEDFLDPNLDKHNNNSDSDDEYEYDQEEEYYWEKEINFGCKARTNIMV